MNVAPTTTIEAPAGLPFIQITRDFAAPIARVFAVFSDPELVPCWLGPREYEMVVDHFDIRSGGSYRYAHRDPATGAEYYFRGSYHTVAGPTTVIQTFEWEGLPGEVSLEFLRLESRGDVTRGHFLSTFRAVEARDGLIASGMERGLRDSHLRIDALLAS